MMKQAETSADGIKRHRRLTVGLRIVGWTTLLGVVLCGLIAVSMLIVRDKDRRAKDEFAKLAPRDHRLAIYDAFWNQISAHYYDQRFTGFDWKTIRREWREKAADASDDLDLYNSVMLQVAVRFPSSHVAITVPPSFLAPDATGDGAAKQGNKVLFSKNLAEILQDDLGFEPVPVQRGNIRTWLVGDVSMGSSADRAGIEPGWDLLNQNLTLSGSGAAHYSGEFLRLESMEQKVSFEQHASFSAPGLTAADADRYLATHTVSVSFDVAAPSTPRRQPLIQLLDGGVLYIRFDTFKEPAIIDNVLAAVANANRHGLILDLRGNTGGLAAQVRRLLSRLLPARSILGEGVGVEPDIEIIPTLHDIRAGHDLVLERAERELRKGV